MIELNIRQEDAKLVYLAIAYHLGRPGSELDAETKRPIEHGLAEIARELQPQLRLAVARISLRDSQMARLTSAMLGSITELKAYPLLDALPPEEGGGRRSSVPGFDPSLRHLFPKVEADAGAAMEIAERMLVLKRRIDATVAAAPASRAPEPDGRRERGWWPFGR